MKEDYLFLLLIVVAVVLMGITYLIAPLLGPPPAVVGEFEPFTELTLGSVGFISEVPAKVYRLGDFRVGETQTETLKSISILDITASSFGADGKKYIIDVPAWYFDTMEKIQIAFDLRETNQYGPLIIKWNGKEFYQDKAYPRKYVVDIGPEYVEEQNTLEVTAGGPGLMFWASTVYVMRDFEVKLVYGPAKLYSFELLPVEMQSFNRGEVTFYGTGQPELSIKVNGQGIYSKSPEGQDSASFTFDSVPLKTGINILSFETDQGLVNLFNTELKIYLLTNEIVRERTFTISESDWASLEAGTVGGRLDFQVEAINTPGSLAIELNEQALTVPTPTTGSNTVYFTKEQARKGQNTLQFSSTGSFDISTVEIGLERT